LYYDVVIDYYFIYLVSQMTISRGYHY